MTLEKANKLLQMKNYYLADQEYKNLLRVNTNNLDAIWGLGRVAFGMNSYQRAYDLFVRCLHINSKHTGVFLSLAQACSALTQFEKTEQALLSAYKLSPHSVEVLYALSIYYCESGDFDKSEQFVDKVFAINQESIKAFALLVRMKKVKKDSGDEDLINKFYNILKANNLPIHAKVLLNYCFADLYHNNKQHTFAIDHYKEANRLQRSLVNFSVEDMQPSIALLLESFNSLFVKSFSDVSPATSSLTAQINITPIFIVSQPRSGSTLLEQMLIGHKDIVSGGELPHIGDDIVQGISQLTESAFPTGCHSLTQEKCLSLALHYLKNLKDISGGQHKFVIDKMPANFQFIGLIKLIIPHAKILHIKRDARDVSWSIYRNDFDALEPHFCSQKEIGEYHHIYYKVMSHWNTVLPNSIHNIQYEDLVESTEVELTKVLSFCGLDFEEACLNFSDKNRVIRTLSDTQLRKGIQKREQPDWLPYEDDLKEMFNLLG